MWHPIGTLFDEIGDSDELKIVLAEFGQDGLEMYDREASARKIFDGMGMHVDSFCEEPTHWMTVEEFNSIMSEHSVDIETADVNKVMFILENLRKETI